MAETLLEDVVDRIRVEVRQCPTDLIVDELRDTIRDFCQHTRAWQIYQQTNVEAAQRDYTIAVPGAWAQPIAVEFMQLDRREVTFRPVDWLDANVADWRDRETDDFAYFTHLSPDAFSFACVPVVTGVANALQYRASYKPSVDADRVESKLIDEWSEAFTDGTLAALKAIQKEPWSDAARAAQCEKSYRTARTLARHRVARSYGNAAQGWASAQILGAGKRFAGR